MTTSVKRFTPLTTQWMRLLALIYRRDTLTERDQRICERHTFYRLMNALTAAGWCVCETADGDGFIKVKRYRVTFKGGVLAELLAGRV